MTWLNAHQRSEALAAEAHDALRRGETEAAKSHFLEAARCEAAAFDDLGLGKPRTLGITAISATALWFKGGDLSAAETFAHRATLHPELPRFAKHELRELLQSIWNEEAQRESGISFSPGQVVVSVKGGEIVTGGAPLSLILSKVEGIQNLFYRTAELLMDLPLRIQGPPSRAIQERYRPWLFQSVPGSYQFAVAIQKPLQQELFPAGDPSSELITETFLSILRAASDDSAEAMIETVPDQKYRQTFLKLTRNLSPTGKSFEQIEIRDSTDRTPVVLNAASRKSIGEILRPPPNESSGESEISLRGNLRALHLDKDWLAIAVDGKTLRVAGVSETVDDLIGPMVNHDVVVRAKVSKRSTYSFIDIERDE